MKQLKLLVELLIITAAAMNAAPPPVAPVRPVTDDYFGTKVIDNYRYFEGSRRDMDSLKNSFC